jgi:predicted DNA-binding protein
MNKTKTKAPASKYPLIAFRLTADMQKQIAVAAKEDGVSKSSVIKSAIEAYLKKRG